MSNFEVADEGLTRMAEMAHHGISSDPTQDAKLYVEFNVQEVLNLDKSKAAGRPIYDLKDYIKIIRPGDRQDITHREVWMDPTHQFSDYHRFGAKYRAWKEGRANTASGTPLSVLCNVVPPILNQAQVKEFLHFDIHTCEHFVGMSDAVAQKFMGVRALQDKVKAFLETAKAEAPLAQMRVEREEMQAQLAAQNQALKEMAEQLSELRRDKGQPNKKQ